MMCDNGPLRLSNLHKHDWTIHTYSHSLISTMSNDHLQQAGTSAGVIAFSCITQEALEDRYFLAAERLGLRIIDVNIASIGEMRQLTHLIAAEDDHSPIQPLCPTFLSALCCNATIVNAQWLIQSTDAGVLLSLENFRVSAHAAETEHSFSLDESLANAAQAHSQGGILHGRRVYLCDDVVSDIPKHVFSKLLGASGATEVETRGELDTLIEDGGGNSVVAVTSERRLRCKMLCGTRCLTMIDFLHVLLHQSINNSIPDLSTPQERKFPTVLFMDNAAGHRTTSDHVVIDQFFSSSPELNPLDVSNV
eukprot:scaffold35421_cov266-Skeletonema_dohrnii-CCMP3373.AAC.2